MRQRPNHSIQTITVFALVSWPNLSESVVLCVSTLQHSITTFEQRETKSVQAHRWPTELLEPATWLLLDSVWCPGQAARVDSLVMLMEGGSCFGPRGGTVNVPTQDRDAPSTGEPITTTQQAVFIPKVHKDFAYSM